MLKRFTFLLTLFLLLLVLQGFSQTIDITPAVIDTICPGDSVKLVAHVTGSGYGTNSYTFEVTTYHVEAFVNDTAVDPDFGANTDDAWAGPYPIGFEFCFLNQHYTEYWVGSNGWIGFTNPQGHSWITYVPFTLPSTDPSVPKNAIFSPYQDWWPHHLGENNVFRHIISYPPDSSKLVVYWNYCPMYGCDPPPGPGGGIAPTGTFQIVLNQKNSIIENNITNKDSCSWQNNAATQGVHNIDGTLAYIAFNRNQTSWTAYNESTRFVPSGVSWYKDAYPGGTMVAQGDTVVLTPMVTAPYFAVVNTCINGTAKDSIVIPVFPIVVPSITGSTDVCMNNTEKYQTQSGMSGYTWIITNGTILSGGTATDDSVTVKWDQPTPPYNVSISYTDLNGCSPLTPAIINVTVNSFITPVITGVNSICAGSQATYTTQAGNTNYLWTYPGATLISGGTTNDTTITLSWPTAGIKTISVNYTGPGGCTSNPPTTKTVTVEPLPIPTFSGPATACIGSTHTYTTDPGMTGYNWTISAGGTINSGQGSNSISVTWNILGIQSLNVAYTDLNGCSTSNPPPYNVTVIPLPLPTITGNNSLCVGSTGNIFTTEAGMTGYNWTVTPDGTITSGSGTNTIQVTWLTAGIKTVSINYVNAGGCTAASPANYSVTVNDLPAPTIIGNTGMCEGTTGTLYSTQPGMSNYAWTVSAGGTITSGGSATDNTATVTWNTAGAKTISVNYNDVNGCTATAPVSYPVTVYPLPAPTIAGPAGFCIGIPGAVYTTQPGMNNYQWVVSAGGTVTAGGTNIDNSVTVTWNIAGAQSVSINYNDANGCTAVSSFVYNVTVNALPVPTILGSSVVCAGISGVVYSTQAGMTNYTWTVSAGGTITSGGTSTDNTVTVTWNTPGAQSVTVNYNDPIGCLAVSAFVLPVVVNSLPVPTIAGNNNLCAGTTGVVYSTQPGMSNYSWTVSAGGTITSGGTATDNTVSVTWNTAGAQTVLVNYYDANNCTANAPVGFPVTVLPMPVPTVTGPAAICVGIPGAVYTTQPGMTIYQWVVSAGGTVTAGGTATDNTITVTWNTAGSQSVSINYHDANGCTAVSPVVYNVTVNPLPVPAIAGPASVCLNSTGTYSTATGMTNYTWIVSAGGTIISGAGTNIIGVLWTTLGSKTITVNYFDANGCTAASASSYNITVNLLPVPVLTGLSQICVGNSTTYTTDAGMTGYSWTVSAGGTITAGGGATDNTVTVAWNVPGAQSVSVNYQAGLGCTASLPTVLPVTVKPKPSITNAANSSVCSSTTLNIVPLADLPGTTFSWTATGSSGNVTGFNNGNGVAITDHLVNTGFNIETVSYAVLPSLNGCDGGIATYIVTVNPVADVIFTPNGQAFCSGGTTNIALGSHVTGATFTWTASGSSGNITGFGPGAGNTITQILNNSGFVFETVTYHVLPAANSCPGTTGDVVISVAPLPPVVFTPCTDITTTTDAKPIILKGGTPLGGIYSGTGVNVGIFYASLAGTGTHNILYFYTSVNGCSKTASLNISVTGAPGFTCDNILTDVRDNAQYPTVKIGTQCWMAASLNFGNTIPSTAMQRDNCIVEKYCYNDNLANCSSLGGLYQWDEMMQFDATEGIQGLCPPAWHVPSENEWTTLFNFYTSSGFAGSPLKSTGYSGFNALLMGVRFDNVNWNFSNFATFLWSSTSHGHTKAWAHSMNTINPSVSYYPGNRSNAFSVRCIKD